MICIFVHTCTLSCSLTIFLFLSSSNLSCVPSWERLLEVITAEGGLPVMLCPANIVRTLKVHFSAYVADKRNVCLCVQCESFTKTRSSPGFMRRRCWGRRYARTPASYEQSAVLLCNFLNWPTIPTIWLARYVLSFSWLVFTVLSRAVRLGRRQFVSMIVNLLPRTAVLAWCMLWLCVHVSVASHSCIKITDVSSSKQRRWIDWTGESSLLMAQMKSDVPIVLFQ